MNLQQDSTWREAGVFNPRNDRPPKNAGFSPGRGPSNRSYAATVREGFDPTSP